jgi:hypothetical protein
MALNACRQCGAVMPAHAHACPKCGAVVAPAAMAYRPPPPRPPQEPDGFPWRTAAGWVLLLAVLAVCGIFFYRVSAGIDQHTLAQEEVEREHQHVGTALAWVQDTLPTTPAPESGPVPTTPVAKQMWVIRRMLVDRAVWEREIRARHGASGFNPPAPWTSVRYQANARSHPAIAKWVEGRVAAASEIRKASAAWIDERTAALARESGVPAAEIAAIFPRDHGGIPEAEAELANAMLEVHRHLVNTDPRVRPGEGNTLLYEREDDLHRFNELAQKLHEAAESTNQARVQRMTTVVARLPGGIRVIRR